MPEERYMLRAIELAGMGAGRVSPNPLVGAVIVKNGRIIGEGYHRRCGEPHAERNALAACTEDPEGASMYVTLEPCCHHGRTPPCTDAILENGIAEVIIGSRDPNPKAAGGAEILRKNGIAVTEHFLRDECDAVNSIFFHYITSHRPYVAMKYAMTADGKTASRTGNSRWISSEASRKHVHTLRHRYTGIMAGIGTVLADDPLLNCRMEIEKSGHVTKHFREDDGSNATDDLRGDVGGHAAENSRMQEVRHPIRIICDSHLRIPVESRLCRTAGQYRTIIAYTRGEPKKRSTLESLGITMLELPEQSGHIHLPSLMEALGRMEIDSILLEGGGTLNEAMLKAGLVQKVYAYIAPLLLGGREAKTPVEGSGFPAPGDGLRLLAPRITSIGSDLLLEYEVNQ